MEMPFNLDSVVQNASKLQLKGGLAGKICQVLIAVVFAIAAIAWSFKSLVVAMTGLGIVFFLPAVVLWRLINLAEKNPQTALMEGAELLLHQQMLLGAKNQPLLPSASTNSQEPGVITLSDQELQALRKPDPEPLIQMPPPGGAEGGH